MNVAFIPARGGSKSIPLKNIKPIWGMPLVYWAAKAAAESISVDKVYVATDSDIIRLTVESFDDSRIEVISRSPHTATDKASTESALLEFAEELSFDNVALIQATSPLVQPEDVDRGFRLLESDGADSVLSVVRDRRFYWSEGAEGGRPLNYDVYQRPRRQDFEGCYLENGALYITSRDALLRSRNRVSGRIALLEMEQVTAAEIDEPEDWFFIEKLGRRQVCESGSRAPKSQIKLFVTDCDGCMTDGGMYYSAEGDELKKFNTRDGMGIARLRECGISTAIISGEDSQAVARRAEKLQVNHCVLACKNKLEALVELCIREGVSLTEVAYLGDDINDFEAMSMVGHSFAPADAHETIIRMAKHTLQSAGGHGAVREVADLIINDRSVTR